MFHRFDARLHCLEQQAVHVDVDHGYGLSSLLVVSHSKEDTIPLASLPEAELDAKIAALTGTRGLSRCSDRPSKRSAHGAGEPSASPREFLCNWASSGILGLCNHQFLSDP